MAIAAGRRLPTHCSHPVVEEAAAQHRGPPSIHECWRWLDEYPVVRDLLALESKSAGAWKHYYGSVWKLVCDHGFDADHVTRLPPASPDTLNPVID